MSAKAEVCEKPYMRDSIEYIITEALISSKGFIRAGSESVIAVIFFIK